MRAGISTLHPKKVPSLTANRSHPTSGQPCSTPGLTGRASPAQPPQHQHHQTYQQKVSSLGPEALLSLCLLNSSTGKATLLICRETCGLCFISEGRIQINV